MSYNLSEHSGLTVALGSAGLAIGSTTTQYAIGTAVPYIFKGVFGTSLPTTASAALTIEPGTGIVPQSPNAFQPIPPGQLCVFLGVCNPGSANAVTWLQGPLTPSDQLVGEAPAVPQGRVAFGAIKVSNASASNFVVGTTAFNAASITTTYFNLGGANTGYAL
jgi:hypothetical protein